MMVNDDAEEQARKRNFGPASPRSRVDATPNLAMSARGFHAIVYKRSSEAS
jgi:hypothetical protein